MQGIKKGLGSLIPALKRQKRNKFVLKRQKRNKFVLPTFRSGYSDLLQGENEASEYLSLYSLASHQVLSLGLSVGSTDLWLDAQLVFFNAAIQHLGSSRPPSLLRDG